MVRQLLVDNNFDDTDFGNLAEEEKTKIQNMLNKVNSVF